MSEEIYVTPIEEVRRFIIDCFKATGTKDAHARIIADNLSVADYRGHYSHGLNRLGMYINDVIAKAVDSNAVPEVEKETVATALVNGHNSLGAVIGKFCMDLAIKKAKNVGIGMVTAYGSNHYGIAGIYALQAMEQNCVGISVTNTSPCMTPTRGKQYAIGSNPISFGATGSNGDTFELDMATTAVALGKIEIKKRKGEPIPEGWALDEDGEVTTDAETALKTNMILPLGGDEKNGGYKGYGLGLMVEILAGIFSGSNYGTNIPQWEKRTNANLGQAFIAIDPEVFAPGFPDRLAGLLNMVKQTTAKDPTKPVLIPGDPEKAHMLKTDHIGGVCYVKDQHNSNNILAKKLNVLPPKSFVLKK